MENEKRDEKIDVGELKFEQLRSLRAFLQSIDHQASGGGTLVPTTFDSASNNTYSAGYCDRTLYELERATIMVHAVERWIEQKKSRTETMRRRAQNQLAPILALPKEVLSEIFLLLRDHNAHVWRESVLAVCAKWRQCAISTPKLWSTIIIDDNTHPSELSLSLARSHSCPLAITITLPCSSNKPLSLASSGHFQLCESILSKTPKTLDRITSLTVCNVPVSGPMPSILFEGGSIRNLTCTFVYGFVDQAERSQSPYELFSRANLSGLQNLRLEGGVVGCFNLGFTAFKALSSLTLNSSVLHPSAWAVLSQCSALKILEWRASEPETDSLPLHNYLPAAYGCDPPLLLELKKVTLQRAAAPLFFSAAITHNVDDVILRLPPRYFLDDIAAYLNDEVRYRIRRFQLYGISKLSEVDIAAILFLFPSLEELVSDSWSISSLCAVDALSQFDPDVDGHWHWRFPNIKRLTFGFGYTMEERKKKKDAAKMLRFEKRLTSKLLLVLNKLAAERAKAKTGSLRIHVRGIHLELPKPNGDDGYWSSVLVEDVAPSAGLENASLNIPESDSDSSDED